MELEPGNPDFRPIIDRRVRMPEPLPVKLVAVADVRMPAPAGVEVKLDEFYIDMLGFERFEPLTALIYRAENFTLHFDVQERPVTHEDMGPQMIEVPSLADAEHQLIHREIEYIRQKGVSPGRETLLLMDPAGNWIELIEMRRIV